MDVGCLVGATANAAQAHTVALHPRMRTRGARRLKVATANVAHAAVVALQITAGIRPMQQGPCCRQDTGARDGMCSSSGEVTAKAASPGAEQRLQPWPAENSHVWAVMCVLSSSPVPKKLGSQQLLPPCSCCHHPRPSAASASAAAAAVVPLECPSQNRLCTAHGLLPACQRAHGRAMGTRWPWRV